MLSDFFDGYLARKKQTISRFGSVLDPAMDKFFVYFTLSIFYLEGNLRLSEALTLLSRDFAICIYGLYLLAFHKWPTLKIEALCFGKITTALQFLVLIALTLDYSFSPYAYLLFVLLGLLALLELFLRKNRCLKKID
ncbi:MAG: CDP-alcohol phosphatidyltransferase family protein, partial [Parachlamydiales bacterium]|jgi:phosphatidylglycerophosphate synthase